METGDGHRDAVTSVEAGLRPTLRKGTLLIASMMIVLVAAPIAPALPGLTEHFRGAPTYELLSRLVLTFPALFIALGSPLAGQIIDRFGRRNLLLGGLVLSGLAGAAGYVLNDLYSLLASRALLGLSIAAVFTSALTLIADYYQGPERSSTIGLQNTFTGLGGMTFGLLGGLFTDFGWRNSFLLYLFPLLIVPAAVSLLYEPESKPELPGMCEANRGLPTGVYPKGVVLGLYAMGLFSMIAFYMLPVQLPYFLANILEVSGLQIGVVIGASTLVSATTSLFYGRLKGRAHPRWLYVPTFLFAGLGFIVVGLAGSYGIVILAAAVLGLGIGILLPNTNLWIVDMAPEHARGRLVGGLTLSIFLGQFLSPFATQPLVEAVGLQPAFRWTGVFILACVLLYGVSLLLRPRRQPARA